MRKGKASILKYLNSVYIGGVELTWASVRSFLVDDTFVDAFVFIGVCYFSILLGRRVLLLIGERHQGHFALIQLQNIHFSCFTEILTLHVESLRVLKYEPVRPVYHPVYVAIHDVLLGESANENNDAFKDRELNGVKLDKEEVNPDVEDKHDDDGCTGCDVQGEEAVSPLLQLFLVRFLELRLHIVEVELVRRSQRGSVLRMVWVIHVREFLPLSC